VKTDARAFLVDLKALEVDLRRAVHDGVRDAVKAGEEDARTTTLYKDQTGALRRSTVGTQISSVKGEIRAGAKHARFIENGTPPHVIEGKGGGTLSFVANGSRVFARRVNHPGTAERPFMAHAASVAEKTLDYGLEFYVDQATSRSNAKG